MIHEFLNQRPRRADFSTVLLESALRGLGRNSSDRERTGGAATEAIRRDRVKSSRVPLAALGTIFLSTL